MSKQPELIVTGSDSEAPTLEHLIALARKLTGREPTKTEIEEAKKILAG
jgi:hypothetical protein